MFILITIVVISYFMFYISVEMFMRWFIRLVVYFIWKLVLLLLLSLLFNQWISPSIFLVYLLTISNIFPIQYIFRSMTLLILITLQCDHNHGIYSNYSNSILFCHNFLSLVLLLLLLLLYLLFDKDVVLWCCIGLYFTVEPYIFS